MFRFAEPSVICSSEPSDLPAFGSNCTDHTPSHLSRLVKATVSGEQDSSASLPEPAVNRRRAPVGLASEAENPISQRFWVSPLLAEKIIVLEAASQQLAAGRFGMPCRDDRSV